MSWTGLLKTQFLDNDLGAWQQRTNLRILERFRAMEVSFAAALPTSVRLTGEPPPRAEAGGQQQLL